MRQERKNAVSGWWWIGGQLYFFKSKLEMRWACFLQLAIKHPDLAEAVLGYHVKSWLYEPKVFKFYGDDIPDGVKGKELGVRVYHPDFKVILPDESYIWHECKRSWISKKDCTKLRCLRKYYPDEKLLLVVVRLPKMGTAKSRKKRASFAFLSDCGYKIHEAGYVFKSMGRWLESVAVEEIRQ